MYHRLNLNSVCQDYLIIRAYRVQGLNKIMETPLTRHIDIMHAYILFSPTPVYSSERYWKYTIFKMNSLECLDVETCILYKLYNSLTLHAIFFL